MRRRTCKIIASVLTVTTTATLLLPEQSKGAGLEPEAGAKETGYLLLETKHLGLKVRIDGRTVGVTPVDVLAVSPGSHKVKINHPNPFHWLDLDWQLTVTISPADTLTVPVIFEKSYSVNSTPSGAEAWLKGEQIGTSPIFLKLFENEVQYLTLRNAGFSDSTFAVGRTQQRVFKIRLIDEETVLAVSSGAVKTGFAPASSRRWPLYSILGATVVSGALALYFREKGNDNFDKYRSTGRTEVLDKFFNDARHYDRLAAVSFGVFQAGLIASFFLFLKGANR